MDAFADGEGVINKVINICLRLNRRCFQLYILDVRRDINKVGTVYITSPIIIN